MLKPIYCITAQPLRRYSLTDKMPRYHFVCIGIGLLLLYSVLGAFLQQSSSLSHRGLIIIQVSPMLFNKQSLTLIILGHINKLDSWD